MYTGRLISSLTELVEQAERKAKTELELPGRMEAWVTTPVFAWEEFKSDLSKMGEA